MDGLKPKPQRKVAILENRTLAYRELLAALVALTKADLDDAWLHFAGWRVNYDAIVEGAAARFDSPPNPWDTVITEQPAFPA